MVCFTSFASVFALLSLAIVPKKAENQHCLILSDEKNFMDLSTVMKHFSTQSKLVCSLRAKLHIKPSLEFRYFSDVLRFL